MIGIRLVDSIVTCFVMLTNEQRRESISGMIVRFVNRIVDGRDT